MKIQISKNLRTTLNLILIFMVAGIAFLGYQLWQSLQDTNIEATNNNSVTVPDVIYTLTSEGDYKRLNSTADLGYNFGFKYPSDWKLVNESSKAESSLKVSLTSPSKLVTVRYTAGYAWGLGGTGCKATDAEVIPTGTLQSFEFNSVPGMNKFSLQESLFAKDSNATIALARLRDSSMNPSYAAGNSYCETAEQYHIVLLDGNDSGLPGMMVGGHETWPAIYRADITLNNLQKSDENIIVNVNDGVTISDVQAARNTAEYNQAKQILLSTTYSRM